MEKTKNGKTMKKALLMGTALISLSAVTVPQAQAASGTGAMSALILTPIVVAGTQVLHFGAMTESGAGGTMLIDTAGLRVPGGAVTSVTGAGLDQVGLLSVSGDTGVNIVLSIALATYTVDDVGAGAPMNVNAFNIRTNAGGQVETITLAASPGTFPLGATLTVGAAQVAGTYLGAYTVNANYQ